MQRAACAVQNGKHSGNHTGGRRGRWPQRSCASTHKQTSTDKRTNTHKQTHKEPDRRSARHVFASWQCCTAGGPGVTACCTAGGTAVTACCHRARRHVAAGALWLSTAAADGCGGPCERRLSGDSPARSLHDGAHRSPHVARCAVACCIAMGMVRGVTMSASCAQHGARCAMSAVWCRLHVGCMWRTASAPFHFLCAVARHATKPMCWCFRGFSPWCAVATWRAVANCCSVPHRVATCRTHRRRAESDTRCAGGMYTSSCRLCSPRSSAAVRTRTEQ
jgi:hypothetical protein